MRRPTMLPALLLLFASGLPVARAQGPDMVSMQREIDALRDTVSVLRARLDAIESRPANAPRPSASAAHGETAVASASGRVAPVAAAQPGVRPIDAGPEAALRTAWSRLEPLLDQDDVRRLLGEPSKRLVIDGRNAWVYLYPGLGTGSVFFTNAGRVSSRQSPFGWAS
jgi:hypothetical protein